MPIVVHFADEKNSAAIRRSGIRPYRDPKVVYFMPVVHSYFISHQWLRELRRKGIKELVGVYFRLPADERVWAGKYNEPHRQCTLGEAMKTIHQMADPLGFEIFVERKIEANEIERIRRLPQKVGWRYMPHAHGRKPCGCPMCAKGEINKRKIRDRLDPYVPIPSLPQVKKQLAEAADSDAILDVIWALRQKKRRMEPDFLRPLLTHEDPEVLEEVALTLPFFRHPSVRPMLETLTDSACDDVALAARESLHLLSR